MTPDDSDFIKNIAHSLADDILKKMKQATEYFREDTECVEKCVTMQHVAISYILASFFLLLEEVSSVPEKEIWQHFQEDVKRLLKEHKNEQ